MPKNDEGEFELVLGNRQLLSVFFIIVILLGVFFTMGYIVGRNSAPVLAEVQRKADKPLTADSTAPAAEPAPAVREKTFPTETAQQIPAGSEPSKETKSAPEPARPSSVAPVKKESARAAVSDQPAAGRSYLQLAATSKREADVLVDVLREKGFRALTAEIQEKPGTWRVLVGPVPEGGTNALRSDLQKAGFPGNAAIPRAF
ncbi:MAG TPA: SPOR domain-containing protein [Bryobacteraceae bacterium]|nr:SPOR domain-containing protein [Bryobacteraceae bacterium]